MYFNVDMARKEIPRHFVHPHSYTYNTLYDSLVCLADDFKTTERRFRD